MTDVRADTVQPGWSITPPGRSAFTTTAIVQTKDVTGRFWVHFLAPDNYYKAEASQLVTAAPTAAGGEADV